MTSRELIRWQLLAERRARWSLATSPLVLAIGIGGLLALWVQSRRGVLGQSNVWFAAALVAHAFTFLRVPFHIYWRQDAALLAQLPIEGGPLFDAALLRCVRAALSTTVALAVAAAPIAYDVSVEIYLRHVAMAGALGLAAAGLLPAVAVWSAWLVALGQRDDRIRRARAAAGIAETPGPPSTAALGAVPGFASTIVFVAVIFGYRWLTARPTDIPTPLVLAAIGGVSIAALVATRARAADIMGIILRDVSALDRQRLAHLEIRPPTAIERAFAKLAGANGALVYAKDARLVRRRFPMAFALGALAFAILVIVGIAQPTDPGPWLTGTLAGGTLYAIALAGRLYRPPIELARLAATLPLSRGGIVRAKLVWLLGWWTIWIAAPALFAMLRQPDPAPWLALLGGGTVIVLVAALLKRA
jgi:hypothetical protein